MARDDSYRTPTYLSWISMKERCLNEKHKDYHRYGGRGITVCSEWLLFENFVVDMGIRPLGMTLDRIDVNGNYEKSNCRWATAGEQANNRRDSVFIEYNGQIKTLTEWCRFLSLPVDTIHHRINKAGWSTDKALSTPVRKQNRKNAN